MSHLLDSRKQKQCVEPGTLARAVRRESLFQRPSQEKLLEKYLELLSTNNQYGPRFLVPKRIRIAPCKNENCQKTDKQHQLWRDRGEPVFRCASCGRVIPDQIVNGQKVNISQYPTVKIVVETSKTRVLSTAGGW